MCLPGKLLRTPSTRHARETMTLGDSDAVYHLVLLKYRADFDWLLEKALSEVHLLSHGASVDLNLHEMGFLLLERSFADLSVGKDTDDGAVLLYTLEFAIDRLGVVLGVLLGVFREGLLL